MNIFENKSYIFGVVICASLYAPLSAVTPISVWNAQSPENNMNLPENWTPTGIPSGLVQVIFDSSVNNIDLNPTLSEYDFSVCSIFFPNSASPFTIYFNNNTVSLNGLGITGAQTNATLNITNNNNYNILGSQFSFNRNNDCSSGSSIINITNTGSSLSGTLIGNMDNQFYVQGPFSMLNGASLALINIGTDSSHGTGGNQISFITTYQAVINNTNSLENNVTISLSNSGTYTGSNSLSGNSVGFVSNGQYYNSDTFFAGNTFNFSVTNTGVNSGTSEGSSSIGVVGSSQINFGSLCTLGNSNVIVISNYGENTGNSGSNGSNALYVGAVYENQLYVDREFIAGDSFSLTATNVGIDSGSGSGQTYVGIISSTGGSGHQVMFNNSCTVGKNATFVTENRGTCIGDKLGSLTSVGQLNQNQILFNGEFQAGEFLNFSVTNSGTDNSQSSGTIGIGTSSNQLFFGSSVLIENNATINISNHGNFSGNTLTTTNYAGVLGGPQFNVIGSFEAGNSFYLEVENIGEDIGSGNGNNLIGSIGGQQVYFQGSCSLGDNANIVISNSGINTNESTSNQTGYINFSQLEISDNFIAGTNSRISITNSANNTGNETNYIGYISGSQALFNGTVTLGEGSVISITNNGTVEAAQILFSEGFTISSGKATIEVINEGRNISDIGFSILGANSGGNANIILKNIALDIETTLPSFTIGELNGDSLSTVKSIASIIINTDSSTNALFAGSIQNHLSTPLMLTKQGAGIQTLSGINTYSGGTKLIAGILHITSDSSLGASSGPLTFDGGTLETSGVFSSNRNTTLTSTGTCQIDNGIWTLTAVIEGGGGLIKTGPGTLDLSSSNTYTGATQILEGILTLTGSGSIENSASMTIATEAAFDASETSSSITLNNLSGAGTVNFGSKPINILSSTPTSFSGDLQGTAGLNKLGTSTLTLSGTNTYTGTTHIETGTLFINGSITSNVLIDEGAKVGGSGTITGNITVDPFATLTHGSTLTVVGDVDNSGLMDLGDSVSEIIISGDLSFKPGSEVDIFISDQGNSLITVGGVTTIDSGSTIELITDPTYDLINNQFILLSSNKLNGTFSTVTSTSILISPILSYIGGDIVANFALTDISALVTQPNALSVGKALTKIFNSGNEAFDSLFISLVPLDSAELTNALNEMQPALFKGITISQENNSVKVQDSLSFRLQQKLDEMHCFTLKNKGVCQKKERPLHIWTDGFGDILHQQSNFYAESSQIGYQTKSAGIVVGVDGNFAKYFYLGALGGYTSSHVDWMQNQGSGNIDTGYAGLYFSALGSLFYANSSIISGFSHYDAKRAISYPGVAQIAKSSHGGSQLLSHFDTGINFAVAGITIRPFDSFDYIVQKENSFTETGAGVYNLKIKNSNAILLRNELGLQLASCFCINSSKWTLSPKVSWVREVRVKGSVYKAAFANTDENFTVTGYFPDRSLVSPGITLTGMIWNDLLTMSLYYNGEFGDEYSDHNFGGQIRYGF